MKRSLLALILFLSLTLVSTALSATYTRTHPSQKSKCTFALKVVVSAGVNGSESKITNRSIVSCKDKHEILSNVRIFRVDEVNKRLVLRGTFTLQNKKTRSLSTPLTLPCKAGQRYVASASSKIDAGDKRVLDTTAFLCQE